MISLCDIGQLVGFAVMPRGGARSIDDGGGGGGVQRSFILQTQKIHKPEILGRPKIIPGNNINSFSRTHVAETSSNEYFSDPLIATKTQDKRFARR